MDDSVAAETGLQLELATLRGKLAQLEACQTQHQRTVQALERSEARYRRLFEEASLGLFQCAPEGRLLGVNPAYATLFGYDSPAQLAQAVEDVGELCADPEQRAEMLRLALDSPEPARARVSHRRRDGSTFSGQVYLRAVRDTAGRPMYLEGYIEDVTAEERVERELRQNETRYQAFINATEDMAFLKDDQFRYVMVNEANARFFGRSRAEIIGHDDYELMAPDSAVRCRRSDQEALQRNEIVVSIEQVGDRCYETRKFPVPLREGQMGVGGYVRDITEHRYAEAALRTSEEKYRSYVDNAPNGIFIADEAGHYVEVNAAACAMTGYAREELLTMSITDLIAPGDRVEAGKHFERVLLSGASSGDVPYVTKSGERRFWTVNAVKLSGHRLLGFTTDITERKRAEDQLRSLYRASQRFGGTLDLDAIYAIVYESIAGLVPCDVLYVSRFDRDTQMIHCVAGWMNGAPVDVSAFPPLPLAPEGRGVQSLVIRSGEAQILGDYARQRSTGVTQHYVTDSGKISAEIRPDEQQPQACLAVPIKVGGEVIGVIQVFSYALNAYSENHLQLVEALVPHAGAAIANARLYQQAENEIQERKRAEESLRKSENLLNKIYDILPVGLWFADKDGQLLRGNPAGAAVWGAQPLVGQGQYGIFKARRLPSGEEIAADDWALVHTVNEGATIRDELLEIETFDGQKKTILNYTAPVLDADGQVEGAIVVNLDISERVHAEALVRESEERLRQIVEQMPLPVSVYAPDGTATLLNQAYIDFFGFPSRELLLGRYNALKDPFVRELGQEEALRRAFAGEQVELPEIAIPIARSPQEFQAQRKDVVILDITLFPVWCRPGELRDVVAIWHDITERKRLEEQLRLAQKMEAIGRLAGGVAHDFNNLLMVINGYSEVLLTSLASDAPHRQELVEIRAAGERASRLTRQLLAFSRRQVLHMQALDLNGIIEGMIKMLDRLIGEDVVLHFKPDNNLGTVKADPGQIEQVVLNLAANARDAMPKGGLLTLETRNMDLDDAYAGLYNDIKPGRYVMLAVSDSGCGMSPEVQQHVFEPFFTTKEQGKGTGLGLSTVYGIIKQSGGTIHVYSEVGHGTTFKILLPRIDEAVESRPIGPAARPRGSETVLVVEDQEDVRRLTLLLLRRLGYTTLEAASGSEALELAQKTAQPIHLVMTDVVMPGMSGADVATHLLELRPGLRVLFASGYTDEAVAQHGILNSGWPLLQKPFTIDELARQLRQALDMELPVG